MLIAGPVEEKFFLQGEGDWARPVEVRRVGGSAGRQSMEEFFFCGVMVLEVGRGVVAGPVEEEFFHRGERVLTPPMGEKFFRADGTTPAGTVTEGAFR